MARSDQVNNGRYTHGGSVESFPSRLGWWERVPYPRSNSDVTFKIVRKYDRRPDLLAYELYGTSSLQWLILQYNNIIDINVEFVDGASLLIPTRNRVFSELLKLQDRLPT